MGRRALLTAGGATAVAAATVGLGGTAGAGGAKSRSQPKRGLGPVASAPRPIPGTVPSGDPLVGDIHWWLPGPTTATTPIIGLEGFGLDVDPSTITDFKGVSAFAVVAGKVKGTDGEMYDCEFDVRAMKGQYVGEDGKKRYGAFAFLWVDLFTPGPGGPEQVHDFTPGVLPNGVFWTMAIPHDAFHVTKQWAKLRLRRLPLCDSFFFGNPQGVASEVGCSLMWKAQTDRIERGEGTDVAPDTPGAFKGHFSDASCTGRVSGRETGFGFKTVGKLDAEGFYANFGEEANGVFL